MSQEERRRFLIQYLLDEDSRYKSFGIPEREDEQKQLLRSLMNVRLAAPVSAAFEKIQDEYLQEESRTKGIVSLENLKEMQPNLYLWQGDITRLKAGAIVNAANSGMTGCYRPCHSCIDNCIHTYAGVQLRNFCDDMMRAQGFEEPTGGAKITPAYNLPCDYVIHTVGPIVQGPLRKKHEDLLSSCYRSCLSLADEKELGSIAFCCISTGVFGFPQQRAAEIAVETVKNYCRETGSRIKTVFNVFKDEDYCVYKELLKC